MTRTSFNHRYWWYIVLIIVIVIIMIGYLSKFRSKSLFQSKDDEVWFPSQPHQEIRINDCVAWYFDNDSDKIILYCHGNYGNMSYYAHMPLVAKRLGYSLMMFDYRGFGNSPGIASTGSIKEDGINVYRWLKQYYSESDIIVWGESLGGSIATWIAKHNKPSKLLLFSTFSNIHDVISIHSNGSCIIGAMVVIAGLIYDSLPINEWLRDVTTPTCIIHSTEDTYVPFLCATINAKSKCITDFIPIEGDHTTPELKPIHVGQLGRFLDASISYEGLVSDLMMVRMNSPLCQL